MGNVDTFTKDKIQNGNEVQLIKEQEVLGKTLRVYGTAEEPLFLAKDVAEWIGHSNSRMMLASVDDDEKVVRIVYTPGGNQECWFLKEDGLYEVLMQSRKPIAKEIKKEIKKILKTIRLTGGYISNAKMMVNVYFSDVPEEQKTIIEGLLVGIEERQNKINALSDENAAMKPKADFFDAVADSKDAIEMGKVAKVLNYKNIGRNKLFEILRKKKIIMDNNIPYQKYVDNGWFRTIEQKYSLPNGETRISIKTLVYQKGVDYIKKVLDKRTAC